MLRQPFRQNKTKHKQPFRPWTKDPAPKVTTILLVILLQPSTRSSSLSSSSAAQASPIAWVLRPGFRRQRRRQARRVGVAASTTMHVFLIFIIPTISAQRGFLDVAFRPAFVGVLYHEMPSGAVGSPGGPWRLLKSIGSTRRFGSLRGPSGNVVVVVVVVVVVFVVVFIVVFIVVVDVVVVVRRR